MADISVPNFCGLLMRSRLLSAEEVNDLRKRWQSQSSGSENTDRFAAWLVKNQYLTEYQSSLLLRGKADHFFLNEYKLLERIGKGRMAGVYRAVHRLGSSVAIKVLPPSKARDPKTFARFEREAELAMRLAHPNIVRTFQTGQADDLHYIVMEHLDGETLDEVLKRRGRLGIAEAVRIVHQALLGLDHIDNHNMVHRDLKPGNLMLVAGAGEDLGADTQTATVKILDIGLGRMLFDEEGLPNDPGSELTTQGDFIGTPDYVAPEQARDSHNADIRSDIYSLGCVLYHALTGQVPFPGNNPVRKMVQHAREAPTPVRSLSPDIPEALVQVVDRMMAKDPAKRYDSAQAAAKALERYQSPGTAKLRSPEADPSMSPYLVWLRSQAPERPAMPLAMPVEPKRESKRRPVAEPVSRSNSDQPVQIDVERIAGPAASRSSSMGAREWILIGAGVLAFLVILFAIVFTTVLILRKM
jgi:serine/threonine protein kinase